MSEDFAAYRSAAARRVDLAIEALVRNADSPFSDRQTMTATAGLFEAMRYALEAKGYEIHVARDGNQGLALAEREDPDLVILDMMMPKRSGFLVLEKLRRTHPIPVRVIMITANEGSRHKAYAEMLGVDDYIRKPFGMDRLLDSVERLLA